MIILSLLAWYDLKAFSGEYEAADYRRFLRPLNQLQFRGRHRMVLASVSLPLIRTNYQLYSRLVVTHSLLAAG